MNACLNNQLPKPGNKIMIIDPDLSEYAGKAWIVLDEPICGKFFGPHDDVIWVGPESGSDWPKSNTRIFLYEHQYRKCA